MRLLALFVVAAASFDAAKFYDVHSTPISKSLCPIERTVPIERDVEYERRVRRANPTTAFATPSRYWLLRCRNVTLEYHNTPYVHYRVRPLRARPGALQDASFFGLDLTYVVFQHDIINGAATIGMAWQWLINATAVRVLTNSFIARLIRPALRDAAGRLSIAQQSHVDYESLYIAAPSDDGPPTGDLYAAHAFEHFMPAFFGLGADRPRMHSVLYLDRPNGRRSVAFHRCTRNASACRCSSESKSAAMSRLTVAIGAIGLRLDVFQHTTLETDQRLFRDALAIVGPHGGAFSNSIWMRPGSKLIEINISQRLCFLGTAMAGGIGYYRYEPLRFGGYAGVMDVDSEDFTQYVANVLADHATVAPAARKCTFS